MRTARLLKRWLPVAAWMGVIFALSSAPGLKAVPVAQRLGLLPSLLGPWSDLAETVLRKGGHLAEYAVLSTLLRAAIADTWPAMAARSARWAWAVAVLYAVTDEIHQGFVPQRDPRALDVFIDAVGAGIGLWLSRRW